MSITVKRLVVSLGFVVAVSGCALVARPYGGPQTANVAYLNVRSLAGADPGIEIYGKAENCQGRYFLENGAHLGRTEVSRSFATIDADRPVSIGAFMSFLTGPNGSICKPILNFTPQSGRYYRIVLTADEKSCFAGLTSSDDAAFTHPRTEKFRRMLSGGMPVDENGTFCEPDASVAP